MNFLESVSKIFSSAYLGKLRKKVSEIHRLEESLVHLSTEELLSESRELRADAEKGGHLDDLLEEAYALVREASRRTLGLRHFDAQLMGGIALHEGKIAEMKTGEGKTLVATLPAYLNALAGKGVHIVTVNDYLAKRDSVWMGQVHHALGLTVGCITHDASFIYDPTYKKAESLDEKRDELGSFKVFDEFLRPVTRKEAYAADITYCTNNELGFDYLRDNMVYSKDEMVQRGHAYAIVDEVDSILIDEARTPLIISAPDKDSTKLYSDFARLATRLTAEADYKVDEKMRAVTLTQDGISKIEQILGIKNIYDVGSLEGSARGLTYLHHLEQALKATILFKKDKDYIVKDGQVVIIDEFTGRILPGRRFSEGLHQAIEAKEGVYVQKESKTLASITFQNYFRLYKKLSGMTGTAMTSQEEFNKVYGRDTVSIPTNKQMIRLDETDLVFKTDKEKWRNVVAEIKKRNEDGQPVLVGTLSIEKNEYLGALLKREGVRFEMLNAKNHEREGAIIAQAGKFGAVTIATNMAGRGVDIILGGTPPDAEEAKKVREAGGLHVIGTERHEARRIDDQLRGRSGRQGDPGSSQFFVSLEDDLMRIFGGTNIKNLMDTFKIPEDTPIENSMVTRAISSAQAKIEGFNFDARKHVLEFDEVMNKHRSTIYRLRKEILILNKEDKAKQREKILELIKDELSKIIQAHTSNEAWEVEQIVGDMQAILNVDLSIRIEEVRDPEELLRVILEKAEELYLLKEKEIGEEILRNVERALYLQTIDMAWMNHLENMDYLRDSVRLRAWGQRDPLVEYKNEGHGMFKELVSNVNLEFIANLFKISSAPKSVHTQTVALGDEPHQNQRTPAQGDKIGRNDPCYCGSGKKYKKCHGK